MGKPVKTARMATGRLPMLFDAGSGQLDPTPRRRRPKFIPLNTVYDVKNELARIYRSAKAGDIQPEAASRFCFILGTLGKLIVDSEHEARLVALEREFENENR